jgi:hypothetical protein
MQTFWFQYGNTVRTADWKCNEVVTVCSHYLVGTKDILEEEIEKYKNNAAVVEIKVRDTRVIQNILSMGNTEIYSWKRDGSETLDLQFWF